MLGALEGGYDHGLEGSESGGKGLLDAASQTCFMGSESDVRHSASALALDKALVAPGIRLHLHPLQIGGSTKRKPGHEEDEDSGATKKLQL